MTRNLEKLLISDPSFFTPASLVKVTQQAITDKVFDGKTDFALLDERTRLVQQVGMTISNASQSKTPFMDFLKQGEWNAAHTVQVIIDNMSGFRDHAIYQGRQVFFYKRA